MREECLRPRRCCVTLSVCPVLKVVVLWRRYNGEGTAGAKAPESMCAARERTMSAARRICSIDCFSAKTSPQTVYSGDPHGIVISDSAAPRRHDASKTSESETCAGAGAGRSTVFAWRTCDKISDASAICLPSRRSSSDLSMKKLNSF